jgi:hypothetical protein
MSAVWRGAWGSLADSYDPCLCQERFEGKKARKVFKYLNMPLVLALMYGALSFASGCYL